MATPEIDEYYDATENSRLRADLQQAMDVLSEKNPDKIKVAIDCGCGAGSNIAHLLASGYLVHAFDIEPESVTRCRKRFSGEPKLTLSLDSFRSFSYPSANLILADASLFFCPEKEFDEVWFRMTDALTTGGIFVGSFLGPRDTMAGPDYQGDAFWPEILTMTEAQLTPIFKKFDIVNWTEHELDGETPQGAPHHWHIFSIIARKQ